MALQYHGISAKQASPKQSRSYGGVYKIFNCSIVIQTLFSNLLCLRMQWGGGGGLVTQRAAAWRQYRQNRSPSPGDEHHYTCMLFRECVRYSPKIQYETDDVLKCTFILRHLSIYSQSKLRRKLHYFMTPVKITPIKHTSFLLNAIYYVDTFHKMAF